MRLLTITLLLDQVGGSVSNEHLWKYTLIQVFFFSLTDSMCRVVRSVCSSAFARRCRRRNQRKRCFIAQSKCDFFVLQIIIIIDFVWNSLFFIDRQLGGRFVSGLYRTQGDDSMTTAFSPSPQSSVALTKSGSSPTLSRLEDNAAAATAATTTTTTTTTTVASATSSKSATMTTSRFSRCRSCSGWVRTSKVSPKFLKNYYFNLRFCVFMRVASVACERTRRCLRVISWSNRYASKMKTFFFDRLSWNI